MADPDAPTAAGTAARRWRLGLLPVEVGTGVPAHDWLQFGLVTLVQQALDGHPQIDLVPTVAALPAGSEALPLAEQARCAVQGLGLDGVVRASLRQQGDHLWLDWQCLQDGVPVQAGSLREVAPTRLGARLAKALAEALFPQGPHDLRPVSDDAFVNQTYARGMEMLLQEDYAAALPLFELVCQLAPHNLQAELSRVRCLGPIGHPSATTEALALLPRAQASGDTRLEARVHVALFVARMRARAQDALQDDAFVMSLAARAEHAHWWREDWLLRHLANRGLFAMFRRQWADAAALLAQAAKACRAASHRVLLAATLRMSGMAHLSLGQLDTARQHLDEALTLYQLMPQAVALLHLRAMRGFVDLASGDVEAACRNFDAFCETLAHAGTPMMPPGTAGWAALGYLEVGRREALASLLLQLEDRPDGLEHHPLGSRLLARAGLTLLEGDLEGSRRLLRKALELRRAQPGGVDARVWALLLLRLDGVAGDRAAAEGHGALLQPFFDIDPGAEWRIAQQRQRAAEWQAQGRLADAAARLAEVVALARPGHQQGAARLDLAWLCVEAGDLPRAESLLQAAGPWRGQHPAGLATDARLQAAHGQWVAAVALQTRALQRYESPAPAWHTAALQHYGRSEGVPPLLRLVTDSWWPAMPAATNH